MREKIFAAGLTALALTYPPAVMARGRETRIHVQLPAQPLATSLAELGRQAGISLVFDPRTVEGHTAPPVRGDMRLDEALDRLLRPAGLGYERKSDGAVLITARPVRADVRAPRVDPGAIPEILIVGRRTLNVDVPRSRDDIQPYEVATAADVENSGAATPDEFLKNHLTSNLQTLSAIQLPIAANGSARSQINLRGLGSSDTLVLVDGHRLPSFPLANAFGQPNINGIPLAAIDRIETLASTGSGIYGPEAIGGVVNIVLRRAEKGAYLSLTGGLTARGDAPNWRIEGRAGWQSPGGNSQLTIAFGHAQDAGLTLGQRPFFVDARVRRAAVGDTSDFLFPLPSSQNINIRSADGNPLVLSAALGGATLSSDRTYLPVVKIGAPDEAATLVANAGKWDLTLPDTAEGAKESLLTATRHDGLVLTARTDVAPGLSLFVDAMATRDRGDAVGPKLNISGTNLLYLGYLVSGDPVNPFAGDTEFSAFPVAARAHFRSVDVMLDGTMGIIGRLSRSWQVELDLSGGYLRHRAAYPATAGEFGNSPFYDLIDPFHPGLLADLAAQLDAVPTISERSSETLVDLSARLAGTILTLPGGPLTLTLLAEMRNDRSPGQQSVMDNSSAVYFGLPATLSYQSQRAASLYSEVRLPLLPKTLGFAPLRALEVQLAARGDWLGFSMPGGGDDNASSEGRLKRSYAVGGATIGMRVHPIGGLMIRASYATGRLPPSSVDIVQYRIPDAGIPLGPDPLRGNTDAGAAGVTWLTGGNPNARPELARTFSVGIVAEPRIVPGMRLSVDYSVTRRSHQIGYFHLEDDAYLFAHADLFPSRFARGPLTPEDAALGYVAGPVIMVDDSAFDTGQSLLRTFDAVVSYQRTTAIGRLAFDAHVSWEPSLRWRPYPGQPSYQLAGFREGPLPLKGNANLTWSRQRLGLGLAAQFTGAYRVATALPNGAGWPPGLFDGIPSGAVSKGDTTGNAAAIAAQGGDKVRAQVNLDAFLTFRLPATPGRGQIDFRVAVQNVFDRIPRYMPLISTAVRDFGLGYSYFSDPRGRRFQLTAGLSF